MEWDCRIKCFENSLLGRTRTRTMKSTLAIFVILILSKLDTANSQYLDCNEVNKVTSCMCSKTEAFVYNVECPTGIYSTYPVKLILTKLEPGEARIDLVCNDRPREFRWALLKGIDLSESKIAAKITTIGIAACPPVSDGFKGLLNLMNVTSSHVKKFAFTSYQLIPSLPQNFLSEFSNLEILILNYNKHQVLPDLSKVPNITVLNLRENRLQSLNADSFAGNVKLEKIVLTGHELSRIEPGIFPESVDFLDLSGLRLSTIEDKSFSNLKKLKYLYLQNSPLHNISRGCFDDIPQLESINLDRVKFKTIFPDFANLPKLTNLSMDGIQFENGSIILKNLPSLTKFSSFQSGLTSLPILEDLPSLKFLDLKQNRIQNLFTDFFSQLPNLTYLDLTSNRITDLVEIRSLRLEKLYLGKNRISKLPEIAFRHLGSLVELQLYMNKITDVDFKAFDSLGVLKYLDISSNEITFSNNPFKNIPSKNFVDDVTANYSPLHRNEALKHLNLSYNLLENIFSDWRIVLLSLENLDLSHNKIKRLQVTDLQFLSAQHVQLNLTDNLIEIIDLREYFLFLDSQLSDVDVYLNGNPLNCNCLAYIVKDFSLKTHHLHFDKLICASPENLQNLTLAEVPDNELLCKIDSGNGCTSNKCSCWQRLSDKTLVINCSNLNFTNDELPPFNLKFAHGVSKWPLEYDLSGNNISKIGIEFISQLPTNTKHINLSKNNLKSIDFLNKLHETSQTNFSLSNNSFLCDRCTDFVVIWATQSSRIQDSGEITCLSPDGDMLTLSNVSSIFEDCSYIRNSAAIQILIICLAILSAIFIIVAILIMRYSWAIKAFLFSKGWGCCLFWDSNIDAEDEEKLYDAFVSYSHKDEDWVLDELVNRLEEQEGFKLCLHFRDWTAGDWIPDQIVRSVDQSRRTVVILSKNFVDSVWSRLEFKAAHAQALSQSSNRVILVLLEDDLKDEDVHDDDLRVYMKMNTYLKWNDPWFWHKLKYALPHKRNREENDNVIKMMQQREKANELDKIRAKLELSS